jgi:hypothetical protein
VVRAWDQEVCFLCGLRFKLYGCSYDGHWRLTWSLTSGPVGLIEVLASCPDTHVKLKLKKKVIVKVLKGMQKLFISHADCKKDKGYF